jgi:protein-S-isoprenylcysteine O-methyltransferase Ste14
MAVLFLGLVGLFAFVLGVLVLGFWLRGAPTAANAEKSSRIVHALFFAGLGFPIVIAFFYPGLGRLDSLVGLNPLPYKAVFLVIGILLAIPGLYLMSLSLRMLRALGRGANAFRLTKRVVVNDIYRYTRNPMSLGYYLMGVGIGFISGSTLLTLFVLLGIIPAHIFALKFFEELELELRFGDSYKEYKHKVPFLFPKAAA